MADDRASSDGGSVQVVRKSAQILDCFSARTPRLRLSEIAQTTGMPTSTVARILRTLVGENLLQRQGAVYSIGLRVIAWSAAANAGSDLIATARPFVAKLRDRCGETCGVYIRQGNSRVAVLQVESERSIIYRGYVGKVMPLHAGAAGKIFMAYDPQALKIALEEDRVAFTPQTVVDPAELEDHLEQVRKQGWAFSEEERERGLNSLAAPVYGADGTLIAAVAIGGPSFRLTRAEANNFADHVTDCASAISSGLLWHGDTGGDTPQT